MEKPLYMHDCTECEFLGISEIGGKKTDGYYCLQGGHVPTVIVRFSHEPSDYQTFHPFELEACPITDMSLSAVIALSFYTKVFVRKSEIHTFS